MVQGRSDLGGLPVISNPGLSYADSCNNHKGEEKSAEPPRTLVELLGCETANK